LSEFNYEAATWGAETIGFGEHTIAGLRLAEAAAYLPEQGKILEIGCGAGRFLRALRSVNPRLELVGTDVSRSAMEHLRRIDPGIEVRLTTDDCVPAADGEFAAVLVIDVLEHVTDPGRMLDEIQRVLRPGGIFHLHVPCEGDFSCLWRWLPGQAGEGGLKRRFGGHIQRFTRRSMLKQLSSRGYELLRVRHSLHLMGNVADVGAFACLALANRRGGSVTTGDLIGGGGRLVRMVDKLVWAEARLLGRVPAWGLHVSARKPIQAAHTRAVPGA
jgi:SAM-dependent methyltransferase